jgi:hypothetical protein
MKFNKNNFNKYLLFLLIFTLGISVLLYQIHVNSIQTTIIEGLNIGESDITLNLLSEFSNAFQTKCLSGCVRRDNINTSKCEEKRDEANNKIYECPWECDNEKFNKNLKNNPELVNELSKAPRCSIDNEKNDCGKCTPNRVF